MSSSRVLLDTDILSALMRRDPRVSGPARAYLQVHGRLTFSLMTRFEVLRGLEAKAAARQLQAFQRLCEASHVLPITDNAVVTAARLYGSRHRAGRLIPDADLLIAATAISEGLPLVSNNTEHFARVPGLVLHNWLGAA